MKEELYDRLMKYKMLSRIWFFTVAGLFLIALIIKIGV